LLGSKPVDLVLLDLMLPRMSGLEVCLIIKERSKVPVLILTALDDASSRRQGLEAGADDFLCKPIQRRELELRVSLFIRLARQEKVIRQQLEALTQLTALKDDLTSMMVHDLRNPLTGVLVSFQLLGALPLTDDDRSLLALGHGAAQQLMDAIEDLLKVRMLEEGRLPLSRTPERIDQLLAQAIRTTTPAALERKVIISLAVADTPELCVDRKLLLRAVENLLANAVRHTLGSVDVAVSRAGPQVCITIADCGPGVPGALKANLFEKFGSRELERAGARRGHGLGLYLVKLVTSAHGGSVEVSDREGGGAVFRLLLPLAAPAGLVDSLPQ
jgi:signal transduction histidine kinase